MRLRSLALASAVALTLLGAAGAGAGQAEAFKPKAGYWSGALGRSGKAEVEMLFRDDGRYLLKLRAVIISPSGRRVKFEPMTKSYCPPFGYCGRKGQGFGFTFRYPSRSSMKGRWFLDRRVYPGYRIPRGQQRMRARWLARPRVRLSRYSARPGERIVVYGSGFIPRERVFGGGGPLGALGTPRLVADRQGRFRRAIRLSPYEPPGTYPATYAYQRNCLTTCFVKDEVRLTVLPP